MARLFQWPFKVVIALTRSNLSTYCHSFALGAFALAAFALGAFTLGAFALRAIGLAAFALAAFALRAFALGAFGLGAFALGAFGLAACLQRSIEGIRRRIPIGSVHMWTTENTKSCFY